MKRLLLTAILTLSTIQAMSQPLLEGDCAFTVASRKSMEEVRTYLANDLLFSLAPSIRVAQTKNSWYSISIGDLPGEAFEQVKLRLLEHGLVPRDSFCSNGKKYIREVPKQAYVDAFVEDGSGRIRMVVTREDRSEIRSRPEITASPVANVAKGDAVSLRTKGDQWSMVVTEDGAWGWLPSRDLVDPTPLLKDAETGSERLDFGFEALDLDAFISRANMFVERQELGFAIALQKYQKDPDSPALSEFLKPWLETIGYAPEIYASSALYPQLSCVLEGTASDVWVATSLLLRVERKLKEIDFEAYILEADLDAWALFDRWGFFEGMANRRIGEQAAALQNSIATGGFCD